MEKGLEILLNPHEWHNPECNKYLERKAVNNKIEIIEFPKSDEK